jgi:hypothetical protein
MVECCYGSFVLAKAADEKNELLAEIQSLSSLNVKVENDMRLKIDEAMSEIDSLWEENEVLRRKLQDIKCESINQHNDLIDERERLVTLVAELERGNSHLMQMLSSLESEKGELIDSLKRLKLELGRKSAFSGAERALRAEVELILMEHGTCLAQRAQLDQQVQQYAQHHDSLFEEHLNRLKMRLKKMENIERALRTEIEETYLLNGTTGKDNAMADFNVLAAECAASEDASPVKHAAEGAVEQSKTDSSSLNRQLLMYQKTETALRSDCEKLLILEAHMRPRALSATEKPENLEQHARSTGYLITSDFDSQIVQLQAENVELKERLINCELKVKEAAISDKHLRTQLEETITEQGVVEIKLDSAEALNAHSSSTLSPRMQGISMTAGDSRAERALKSEIEILTLDRDSMAEQQTTHKLQLTVDYDRAPGVDRTQQRHQLNTEKSLRLEVEQTLVMQHAIAQLLTETEAQKVHALNKLEDVSRQYNLIVAEKNKLDLQHDWLQTEATAAQNEARDITAKYNILKRDSEAQESQIFRLRDEITRLNAVLVSSTGRLEKSDKMEEVQLAGVEPMTLQLNDLQTISEVHVTKYYPTDETRVDSEVPSQSARELEEALQERLKRAGVVEQALRLEIESLLVEHDHRFSELKTKESSMKKRENSADESILQNLIIMNNELQSQITELEAKLAAQLIKERQLENAGHLVDKPKENLTEMELIIKLSDRECEVLRAENQLFREQVSRFENNLIDKPEKCHDDESVHGKSTIFLDASVNASDCLVDSISELQELALKSERMKLENQNLKLEIEKLKVNKKSARTEREIRSEIEELLMLMEKMTEERDCASEVYPLLSALPVEPDAVQSTETSLNVQTEEPLLRSPFDFTTDQVQKQDIRLDFCSNCERSNDTEADLVHSSKTGSHDMYEQLMVKYLSAENEIVQLREDKAKFESAISRLETENTELQSTLLSSSSRNPDCIMQLKQEVRFTLK